MKFMTNLSQLNYELKMLFRLFFSIYFNEKNDLNLLKRTK